MRVTEVTYFDRIPETDFYAPSSDELIAEIYRLFGALSVSFLPGPTGWQCQSVIGRKTYTGTEQPTMADSAASLFVILSEIFNQK